MLELSVGEHGSYYGYDDATMEAPADQRWTVVE